MRCRQARSRLSSSNKDAAEWTSDHELIEHLRACPTCARYADSARLLGHLFDASGGDNIEPVPSLLEFRGEIEREEASSRSKRQRPSQWTILIRRPVFSAGVVTAVIMLCVLTLVPFRYDQTVGYEVAFAGVEPEFVDDNMLICDVLYELGLHDADVDILGCDTTCRVEVVYLKSQQEVQMVVNALSHLHSHELMTIVRPVREETSGNLLERTGGDIL